MLKTKNTTNPTSNTIASKKSKRPLIPLIARKKTPTIKIKYFKAEPRFIAIGTNAMESPQIRRSVHIYMMWLFRNISLFRL